MFPTIEDTRQLLETLSESYAVEVKRWFDPAQPEGQAKLVRTLMALRNNGGGRLVVGFDDASMKPTSEGRPKSVRAAFDQDQIQALVSRFASEPFEVLIQYADLADEAFPVICVPAGVRTPVATKSELKDAANQKTLVPIHAVFVRTLSSNNVVSTAAAQWRDWDRLAEICFDNREADIGRFIRRHLAPASIAGLSEALGGLGVAMPPVATEQALLLLDEGHNAFELAAARDNHILPQIGYFEFAAVISGRLKAGLEPDRSLLNLMTAANRRLTGRPFFSAVRTSSEPKWAPQHVNDGWETVVIDPTHAYIDFWRVQADGKLYTVRGFDEDLRGANKTLGISIPIWRVGDALVEALAIARQMVDAAAEANLHVALRWTSLAGRRLSSDGQWFVSFAGSVARDDSAVSQLTVPVDLPDSAVSQHVALGLKPLYRRFEGMEIEQQMVEAEIKKLLSQN
ncbi:ATP-binding protein [Paraburkholderia sp. Tr-20389]|uniref:AlbA family DNA-binding domain-containing protein n=1 Tax=Paraburkholderia sp. Tr-20389 TaxID=2703903 RepID=UPI0019815177|nr:RNA-binding domain-containing protein [Paraburkholderia sp. Tr-20389]MBN3755912.1 ATP-binding protein [Paraburkholderia sp. Tr-20389]